MSEQRQTWDEEASEVYRKAASVAVPARDEQIAAFLMLVPFDRNSAFRIVDIGAGEGQICDALLTAYPNATALLLDGSTSMQEKARLRLRPHADRFEIEWFDLLDDGWHGLLDGADYIVSSLAIHHLDAGGKKRLFESIGERLNPKGALIVADLLDPLNSVVQEFFAATYDAEAKRQASLVPGDEDHYQFFINAEWNFYLHPDPGVDMPSRLHEQLDWLRESGFQDVDCFWLRAGHAIYGGFKSKTEHNMNRIAYGEALHIARDVLERNVEGTA